MAVNYYYDKETGEIPCHTKEIFRKNGLLSIHKIILAIKLPRYKY